MFANELTIDITNLDHSGVLLSNNNVSLSVDEDTVLSGEIIAEDVVDLSIGGDLSISRQISGDVVNINTNAINNSAAIYGASGVCGGTTLDNSGTFSTNDDLTLQLNGNLILVHLLF